MGQEMSNRSAYCAAVKMSTTFQSGKSDTLNKMRCVVHVSVFCALHKGFCVGMLARLTRSHGAACDCSPSCEHGILGISSDSYKPQVLIGFTGLNTTLEIVAL